MARIFNIYFIYDEVTHSAVVSVRTTPFFTEYTLGNLDTDLVLLLPSNKIISQAPDRLFFQNMTQVHSQNLMDVIIKSITKHLHANNDITSQL
jgi:hypothetical protein